MIPELYTYSGEYYFKIKQLYEVFIENFGD